MDALPLVFIAGYVWGGWRSGFLRRLIGLGFLALSFVAGAYLRYPIAAVLSSLFKDVPEDYARLVGYALVFPIVIGVGHFVGRALTSRVAVQGLSKATDKVLGAVLGAAEAVLILSAVVAILDTYSGTNGTLLPLTTLAPGAAVGSGLLADITKAFNDSTTVHILRQTTVPVVLAILGPFLPKDVSSLIPTTLPTGLPAGLFPTHKP